MTFRFCTNCPKAGTKKTRREDGSEAEQAEQKHKRERSIVEGENREKRGAPLLFLPLVAGRHALCAWQCGPSISERLWSLSCLDSEKQAAA